MQSKMLRNNAFYNHWKRNYPINFQRFQRPPTKEVVAPHMMHRWALETITYHLDILATIGSKTKSARITLRKININNNMLLR